MVEFTPFTTIQGVAVFVNSTISRYIIDSFATKVVQTCLGKEMIVDGWISSLCVTGNV